jgi:hypothetical protein
MARKSVVDSYDTNKGRRSKASLTRKSVVDSYYTNKGRRSKASATRKSVVDSYVTNKARRSKASAIAVSTQWDSRESVPTGHETATINSSHTTIAEYHTHMRLWTLFHPSYSPLLFIRLSASQVQFFLLQRANFDRKITPKKTEAMETCQYRRFYFEV